MGQEHDSGIMSMDVDYDIATTTLTPRSILASFFPYVFAAPQIHKQLPPVNHRSGPSVLSPLSTLQPNYKLLHLTHTRLHNRFLYGSYRLSILQTRPIGSTALTIAPNSPHTNTIYCLQLYTNPKTGVQTLFTGSRDKSIREWNIRTSQVIRIVQGVHSSSVLSLCVDRSLLVSAGSDRRVVVWELNGNELLRSIQDHTDSVLAVRFDERRLVSCSKGMNSAYAPIVLLFTLSRSNFEDVLIPPLKSSSYTSGTQGSCECCLYFW
jgi:WD40 repeat protein